MNHGNSGDPRLLIAQRLPGLQSAYREQFNAEFDLLTFGDDDFYAFQVLEKSIRDGSPALQAVAGELEELLVRMVETGSSTEIFAAGEVAPAAVPQPAAPVAAAQAVKHAEPPQPSAGEMPTAPMATGDAASQAGSGDAPTLPGEAGHRAAQAAERRGNSGRVGGHVRLGNREIVCLSQLRVQYRRTFGVFIDIFEFTGNDLYARSLLSLCAQSQDPALVALSREFLNEDSTPRLHRRKGVADIEFTLH